MSVGDVRHEIRDADYNLLGYIVSTGVDGMTAKELRNWRQLWLRRNEEAKSQQK